MFGDNFTRTWIGNKSTTRSGNRSRRRPLSAIKPWNQWSTVSAYGTATNNSLECFNRVWNSQVGSHPNVWNVIDASLSRQSQSLEESCCRMQLDRICIKIQEGRRELWPIINVLSYLLNSLAFCLTKNICSRWLMNFKNRIIN